MDSIGERLDRLEVLVDVDDAEKSVVETISTLNTHINSFINKDEGLVKLFQNLNNSKIRFYYDKDFNKHISDEEIEIRKQFIYANLQNIESHVKNLSYLQNLEQKIELDPLILTKNNEIREHFDKLQNLELKYNQLLIRSINLLQNFLNLNDNITKFTKNLEYKNS